MTSPRAGIIAFAAATLLEMAPTAHAQVLTGRAVVIDGGTLEVRGQRVGLSGIAQVADDHVCVRTDDERWRCGPRALNALEEFLEESVVSCVMRDSDAQGHAVATCSAGGLDLSLWLLRNGLAMTSSAASGRYLRAQDEARAARRGLWAAGTSRP